MDFPVDTLPPMIRDAIQAQAAMGDYPIEAVGPAALAVMSFAAQGLADVDSLHSPGKTFPLSLLMMILARSGDAKTSLYEKLMFGVWSWQANADATYKADLIEYQAARKLWDHDRTRAEKAGDKDAMVRLGHEQPVRPASPHNIVSKITTNGLFATLEHGWPTMGLFTSEGGSILGGHSLRRENSPAEFASALCNLWDGNPIDRTTAEVTMRISNRRLAGLVMVQGEVASEFLTNPVLKSQGIHARFLVSVPPAWKPRPVDFTSDREASRKAALLDKIAPFQRRVEEMLAHPLITYGDDRRELRPRVLSFDLPAREHLQAWTNGTAYPWREEHRDTFFGRSLEHVQRIAGVLTLFERWHLLEREIDPDEALDDKIDYWRARASETLPVIGLPEVQAATALVGYFANQLLTVESPIVNDRDTRKSDYVERVLKFMRTKPIGTAFAMRDFSRNPLQRVDLDVRVKVVEQMIFDELIESFEAVKGAVSVTHYRLKG